MKIIVSVLAMLAAILCGPASAVELSTASQTAFKLCTPYKIPIQSTIVACGPGMVGTKYKTSSFDCVTGKATESTDYDVGGCVSTSGQMGSVLTDAKKCFLTPDACGTKPAASACPVGQHWSLVGTHIAHCVPDDPTCTFGASIVYDTIGYPTCVANTCTGGKVLQSDGISCGCPVNTVLSGGTCVAAPPTCLTGYLPETAACDEGLTGTKTRTNTAICIGGPYGKQSIAYSAWDTSKCVSPTITCTALTTQENGTCSAGTTGTKYRNVTTSCPNGSYSEPLVVYGSWVDNCVSTGVCVASTKNTVQNCPAPMSGSMAVVTKTTCPGSVVTVTQNLSGCTCANNALDKPTCTAPAITYGCKNGTSVDGCELNPPSCSGATWTGDDGYVFCVTNPSVTITNSKMKLACSGKTTLPEVRIFNVYTAWQRTGYTCSVPSNTVYSSAGLELNPPYIQVPSN